MMKLQPLLIGMALAVLLPIPAHSQTPITSVPITITTPGTYIVANELSYPSGSGNAITVDSSNVTIDFDGNFLYCTVASPLNNGILVNNKGNVTIKNGSVVNFYHCIYFSAPSSSSLNVAEVVENMRVANGHDGIYLVAPSGCSIRRNYVEGFSSNGILVGNASPNNGSRIQYNHVISCSNGYNTFGGNYIFNNFASACSAGFNMDPGDKYRFNVTNNCTSTYLSGTALTNNNN
jgi:hypothetical protein